MIHPAAGPYLTHGLSTSFLFRTIFSILTVHHDNIHSAEPHRAQRACPGAATAWHVIAQLSSIRWVCSSRLSMIKAASYHPSNMAARSLVSAIGIVSLASANVLPRSMTISFEDGLVAEAGGMHNVQISYNAPLDGDLSLHYGSCEARSYDDCHHELGRTHVGSHDLAKRHADHPDQRPSKFVWLPPADTNTGGCLHAFSGNDLVGRSAPVTVTSKKQKRWTAVSFSRCTKSLNRPDRPYRLQI